MSRRDIGIDYRTVEFNAISVRATAGFILGQHGFGFVHQWQAEGMVLTSYGRSTGFCIDPIEKKPLHHFLPGSKILSFGTAGCNLGCLFCQNWSISKSREMERLSAVAFPKTIAHAAKELGCSSVAFTVPWTASIPGKTSLTSNPRRCFISIPMNASTARV